MDNPYNMEGQFDDINNEILSSQINNPCKGMGIVQHGAVSVTTGLNLSGHIQTRDESTSDCVTIIQKRLTKGQLDAKISFKNTPFLFDRDYGGPDGSIHQACINRNVSLVRTAKRTPSYPYIYGKRHYCKIPLCTIKRYDGKPRFQMWHIAKELNNPCSAGSVPRKQIRVSTNNEEINDDDDEEINNDNNEETDEENIIS